MLSKPQTSLYRYATAATLLALVLCIFIGCSAVDNNVVSESAATTVAAENSPPTTYGPWVLAPALVAIICAIATRQVVPSLLLGTVVACGLLVHYDLAEQFADSNNLIRVSRLSIETYVIGSITSGDNAKVILFTIIVGGMVGVVESNGGTRALVDVIARKASNRRRGQLTGWISGLVVFFDDYANTMIVGPTMQPIYDRLKISRAKLAYIVDSTAAPVASIAIIGTWIGAEIGYIQEGIDSIKNPPAFLAGIDGWTAFVNSIPYRFYPILALVLVFIVAVSGRDIGPMRRAEEEALALDEDTQTTTSSSTAGRGWWLAALPIATLILVTFAVLLWPGLFGRPEGVPLTRVTLFENADAYVSILYGALTSTIVAIAITLLAGAGSLKSSMEGLADGMARMLPAVTVLVLAWSLSRSSQNLLVGEVVRHWLIEMDFSITWLPLAVFVSAAGVSFATGTSWGTMGILCPIVVTVSAGLAGSMPTDQALPLFYASVGSVLAGAIFGDHCSPISDTTVLSSLASGCTLERHVWTQLPYAIIAAVVAMAVGDTMCNKLSQSPWLGLLIGTAILAIIIAIFGRPPRNQKA